MEKLRGLFNPVAIDIIHGCLVSDRVKIAAEVSGIHACLCSKRLQSNGSSKVAFNIFQNGFDLIGLATAGKVFCIVKGIISFLQNNSKQAAETGKGNQFVQLLRSLISQHELLDYAEDIRGGVL